MGARGYLPVGRNHYPIQTGMYIAGIFGEIRPGITDFVNLPTPIAEEICIDGIPASISGQVRRELDLHNAVLTIRAQIFAGEKHNESLD